MPTLAEISKAVHGHLEGPADLMIHGISSLERAGPAQLAPLDDARFAAVARSSAAGALLVSRRVGGDWERPRITVGNALVSLNGLMEFMGLAGRLKASGTHATSVVDPSANVHPSATVGPYAVVEAGVRIGARTQLGAHVVVEQGVVLGDDCRVAAGAVLHEGLVAGNRVRIGAHAVLSRPGFAYSADEGGPVHLHHIGLVVLEDDVHVGACTTIDRARFDETRVGRHSALDNHVHVAHNCRIGQRTFVAAQTGLAGYAYLGDDCEVGGQVGISNRCGVGNRCRIAGRSAIIRRFGDSQTVFGYPAFDKPEAFRMIAALRRLASRENGRSPARDSGGVPAPGSGEASTDPWRTTRSCRPWTGRARVGISSGCGP